MGYCTVGMPVMRCVYAETIRLLIIVGIIVDFVYILVKNLEEGILADNYSVQKFLLPKSLGVCILLQITQFQSTCFLDHYPLSDRINDLIRCYTYALIVRSHLTRDADFIQ